jgi:hypothetical protein
LLIPTNPRKSVKKGWEAILELVQWFREKENVMGRYIAWGRPSRKGGGSFFGELQPTDDLYATLSARHQIRQQAAVHVSLL